MGKRGPKPKPTALKIAQGNPGKRRLPKNEVKPPAAVPTIPAHLDTAAKTEWRRIVQHLEPLGLVSQVDRAALAAYCQVYSRWVNAEQQLAATGGAVVKSPAGTPIQNPWLSTANKALQQLTKLMAEFGLSPASRAGLESTAAKPDADPLAAFLKPRKIG